MQNKHWQRIIIICAALTAVIVFAGCVQPASDEIAPTDIGSGVTFTPPPPATVAPADTNTPTVSPEAVSATETATETATATATNTATATPSPTDAQSALVVTEVAQVATEEVIPGAISDSQMTATAIIANATATQSFIQTATAGGVFGGTTPTFTPIPTTDGAVVATPVAVPPVAGADCVHEVRAEDGNLYRLSLAYGVPILDIAQASGIVNPDLISIGQRLTIPGCGTTGGVPPATSTPGPNANAGTGAVGGPASATNPTGDCTWGTSVVFPNGCPNGTTGAAAGNTAASAGTGGPAAVPSGRTHRVAQGDTLFAISLQYGVTIDSIMAANGITDPDSITFNDTLIIP